MNTSPTNDKAGQPSAPTQGAIERFERWLSPVRFTLLVLILVLLNFLVYFWWSRPFFANSTSNAINSQILSSLKKEKQQLGDALAEGCDSPLLTDRRNRVIGPLRPSEPISDRTEGIAPNTNTPTTNNSPEPIPQNELVRLLNETTVRVISSTGSLGSGFFISKDTIVTNRHVIDDNRGTDLLVTSQYLGPSPIKARIMSRSEKGAKTGPDFAVLKLLSPPQNTRSLAIAGLPTALEPVAASGFPYRVTRSDTNEVTPATVLTDGKVSVIQKADSGATLVVHTADISRGSSGGPLVNRCGQLVGVNTLVGVGEDEFDGRSLYALSTVTLKQFLDKNSHTYDEAAHACKSPTSLDRVQQN